MNLLASQVVDADASGVTVALPSGARVAVPIARGTARQGDTVTLGIRPEGLRVDPAGPIAGEVKLVERLGGLTLLHVTAEGDHQITVQTEGTDSTRSHQAVHLSVDAAACHLFDTAGLALQHLARHPLAA
ncbi:MAG: TOBE domain-containing protein, partial [Acetobacteraceae bacterium]